jgi:hypothetical protein
MTRIQGSVVVIPAEAGIHCKHLSSTNHLSKITTKIQEIECWQCRLKRDKYTSLEESQLINYLKGAEIKVGIRKSAKICVICG